MYRKQALVRLNPPSVLVGFFKVTLSLPYVLPVEERVMGTHCACSCSLRTLPLIFSTSSCNISVATEALSSLANERSSTSTDMLA